MANPAPESTNEMVRLPLDIAIRTARCLLRRIDVGDAGSVHAALSVPGFTDGLIQPPLNNVGEAEELIGKYLAAWDEGTRFIFAIEAYEVGFVGMINLFKRDQPGLWSVGFWIMPERWGKGFAPEAARAAIDLAFEKVGAQTVHAAHVHWNEQSRRVLGKLGLSFKFRREQGIQKNGEWIPNLHYEITKKEWADRLRYAKHSTP